MAQKPPWNRNSTFRQGWWLCGSVGNRSETSDIEWTLWWNVFADTYAGWFLPVHLQQIPAPLQVDIWWWHAAIQRVSKIADLWTESREPCGSDNQDPQISGLSSHSGHTCIEQSSFFLTGMLYLKHFLMQYIQKHSHVVRDSVELCARIRSKHVPSRSQPGEVWHQTNLLKRQDTTDLNVLPCSNDGDHGGRCRPKIILARAHCVPRVSPIRKTNVSCETWSRDRSGDSGCRQQCDLFGSLRTTDSPMPAVSN